MPYLRYFFIFLSLVVGLILMILPLPETVQIYRPHWVALVLIYWSMALPDRVGLFGDRGLGICAAPAGCRRPDLCAVCDLCRDWPGRFF